MWAASRQPARWLIGRPPRRGRRWRPTADRPWPGRGRPCPAGGGPGSPGNRPGRPARRRSCRGRPGSRHRAATALRERYHPEQYDDNSRINVALLRAAVARDGPGSASADLANILLRTSDEFARLWERHEVGLRWSETKRFVHPQVGALDLYCQLLLEPDQGQSLLVFTATPGTESHEKLALLTVLGTDRFAADTE
ncbi:hypothetical protein [Streptomyces sp. NPDC002588]|uniref:MmyB family transcriptional regulator n=1 Tax=Streptomyces sp. NPDC002588 TaxID=3154419 RepID=UPI00331A78E2